MHRYLFFFVLLAISSTASAIIIRSDVDDAKYRIPAPAFPALADMPGEGHGVLIAPQWVLTAAHAAPMQGMEHTVSIGGVERQVECVITYPTYTRLPEALVKEALASGNPAKIHQFLAASDDIALVKLAAPVRDVTPVLLYRGDEEIGKTVQIIGKGATGNGTDGQLPNGSHRTILRRALNAITGAGPAISGINLTLPRRACRLRAYWEAVTAAALSSSTTMAPSNSWAWGPGSDRRQAMGCKPAYTVRSYTTLAFPATSNGLTV